MTSFNKTVVNTIRNSCISYRKMSLNWRLQSDIKLPRVSCFEGVIIGRHADLHDCRRIRRQIVAEFGDYIRHCGQGLNGIILYQFNNRKGNTDNGRHLWYNIHNIGCKPLTAGNTPAEAWKPLKRRWAPHRDVAELTLWEGEFWPGFMHLHFYR